MSALANRPFVKMNGLGNEIVVVDMRKTPAAISAGRRARRGAAGRRALRPAHGALSAAHGGHRFAHPHLQQRRLGGRRLRQRHALRRLADHQGERQGQACRSRSTAACSAPGRTPTGCSPSTWARRALPGTRFRWPRNSATPARSNCRSGRSTSRSCIRRRWSAWAIRTRSSGSMTSNAYDLAKFGPMLENHPMFPERANITLCAVQSKEHIVIRTWERGAGLTKACGSAACAAAVAAARLKRTGRKVRVTLPGGDLADRLARERRPRADDRAGRVRVRGHVRSGACSPRPVRRERRRRHLRLPAQHRRVRGDPPRGRRPRASPMPWSSTPARSPAKR